MEPRDPLFSPDVDAALDALPADVSELVALDRLRRQFGPELARRAVEQRVLRPRAARKSPSGALHWLTRKGLEQATHESVARWRAARFVARAPGRVVFDATCGLGADALALASAGLRVVAGERDRDVVPYAAANARRAGSSVLVVRADATRPPLNAPERVALFDPDRRSDGERLTDPKTWSPSWSSLLAVSAEFAGACIKLAPGFDRVRNAATDDEGPALERAAWSIVSHRGELVETTLWRGLLAPRAELEAVVIDARGEAHAFVAEPGRPDALDDDAARAARFVVEPDVALLQADLLGAFARGFGARALHADIGFLGADAAIESPFARSFRVLGVVSADAKQVRAMLREHDVGPVTVKKRGHPAPADVLAKQFAGSGSKPGLVIVARLERGHVAYLVESPAPR